MPVVIKMESVGKRYVLRHQAERYLAFRDVLANGAKSFSRRIMHPSQKAGQRTMEEFWALKDVSFEIRQGDRVGIVGRNGAGKSTLLKVLSRIVEPTSGRVAIKGRVASLLEVGTGFHPELTGRENIYLNGAILGMHKTEIKKKFDEIVAFAEVDKFLDTPVKHFSSGMYVRLAFAVAAHLEPEILIIDEVLAVGDMQFQKKCLGKMEEVGKEGRTLLFVSHNMSAVLQLTNRGILLKEGRLHTDGSNEECVQEYMNSTKGITSSSSLGTNNPNVIIDSFHYQTEEVEEGFNKTLKFRLDVNTKQRLTDLYIMLTFTNSIGARILTTKARIESIEPGFTSLLLGIDNHRLTPGDYNIGLWLSAAKDIIFGNEQIIAIELTANCVAEPLLLPHLLHGKDKLGAFCPIDVTMTR